VTGLVSFSVGLSSAPTWMVGLASSFGPAVTILVAVALLGERLRPIQWFGLVGVAIGMIAIGLP
jgi:drug/metabolite transporter (DMT)-like permease